VLRVRDLIYVCLPAPIAHHTASIRVSLLIYNILFYMLFYYDDGFMKWTRWLEMRRVSGLGIGALAVKKEERGVLSFQVSGITWASAIRSVVRSPC